MNILIIGARGSGKSTIGRLLAHRMNRRFVDLDELALARFNEKSVRDVWDVHGEASWRNAETTALDQAMQEHGLVISLGGGTPTIPAAKAMIEAARAAGRAQVWYASCPEAELVRRLRRSPGDRPRLKGGDGSIEDEVRTVLRTRGPVYAALADGVVDTASLSPVQIVEHIMNAGR